ncbi:MAG: AAA family ATPase [Myxococcales bacterium]|nr:AAA family ATPase [Myxococcales bacterium]
MSADDKLLGAILAVLDRAKASLLAREVSAELRKRGIEADKSAVNAILYRHSPAMFAKDEDHRWRRCGEAGKASALQAAKPAGTPKPAPTTQAKVKPVKPKTPLPSTIGPIEGSRKLAASHVSIRVPWHDAGWEGTLCQQPAANTACTILVNIGTKRDDQREAVCAGRRIDQLPESQWPPCVAERVTFLSPFELTRSIEHVYTKSSPGTHGHLGKARFRQPAYAAPAIPFDWLRRPRVEGEDGQAGLAERLQLGYDAAREPILDFNKGKGDDGQDKEGLWVNARENQLCLLDTFFSAVQRDTSLCFFYAKRTPLAPDDNRRVIVGVGYVTGVGESVEYDNSEPEQGRAVTFERNVFHSIRPGFANGFVLPYQAVLTAAEKDPAIDPASCVAFVPDEDRRQFSYVTEHVSHDAAIAALLACAGALQRSKGVVAGDWEPVLGWIDSQLNRLWRMRGPCPGLGSALTALGVQHGTLIAQDLAAKQTDPDADPWQLFEQALDDPSRLSPGLVACLGADVKRLYKKLPAERRRLLHLVSRFALSEAQATRFYQETERSEAGIVATDAELLRNPYLLYERDRSSADAISLMVVDRGLFPDEQLRTKHPLPKPSALEGALDGRRVRAFVIDALETAANAGDTLQLRDRIIQAIRERDVKPELPLSKDVLGASDVPLSPFVVTVDLPGGELAFQLDRFVSTGELIRREVKKRAGGKRHTAKRDWRQLIDQQFGGAITGADQDEVRARQEKAAALAELYAARVSVLLGAAGTGKTTLLKSLCELPDVDQGGVLMLAPTGKARVKLEAQTKRPGAMTVAQFLLKLGRYDTDTGRYFMDPANPKRSGEHKTVIIDECSMLTEEQLAAIFEGLSGVERMILVGDPRQLPPIGSGRPFVDIVRHLEPADVETRVPRVSPGYAELTVSRRQKGAEHRDDLSLARWFSGRPVDAGADDIWSRLLSASPHLRLERWETPAELQQRLRSVLAEELGFRSPNVENDFEASLGATLYNDVTYFRRVAGAPSVTEKAEDWQILSPVRAGLHGVDAINRFVQEAYRGRAKEWAAHEPAYQRKISQPFGPQGLLYGDKVISVRNGIRKSCWPKPEKPPYVANGDIGIAIGEYKAQGMKFFPRNLEVEFVAHPGLGVKYWRSEFGDDAVTPLELAYALTVHKTQGSEFGITFVVLPNPCRLLSRELLYTALTRQRNKLVLFHQGDAHALLQYADASQSEIARRCTNLFDAPRMVEVESRYLDEHLIHRTARGERVRSKSELILADKLHAFRIDYAYERRFNGQDGSYRLPDFTVEDPASGELVIWEHLGMLAVPAYAESWKRKQAWYAEQGVLPGGGPKGTLVTSEDSPGGGLDSCALDDQIRRVFSL